MNLAEIKAREKAATPGPWHYCGANEVNENGCDCGLVWGPDGNATVAETNTGVRDKEWKWNREVVIANGLFIAHAREDIPVLIAEVERKSKEALSFHAQATEYYEETERLKAEIERLRVENKIYADVCALAEAIKE